ncbi:hypothetical protein AXF42_Ash019218 [Apostasia shenzhenica]|uniref:Uncharacterized protein n=1 Tax=Apostasia shenzhenica TaxID=1088818 RepID=A0A2I0A2W7_9ASPA|nr:hypothetical protein AXF42_Ash019218 [Apostasia shenzhenica]
MVIRGALHEHGEVQSSLHEYWKVRLVNIPYIRKWKSKFLWSWSCVGCGHGRGRGLSGCGLGILGLGLGIDLFQVRKSRFAFKLEASIRFISSGFCCHGFYFPMLRHINWHKGVLLFK